MRLIFFYSCVTTFILNTVRAQEGNCDLDEVKELEWIEKYVNEPKNDDERVLFQEFHAKNIESVSLDHSMEHYIYVDLDLSQDKSNLKVVPSPRFAKFEEELRSNKEQFQLKIKINFKCTSGGRSLSFYQPIIDLNTYVPEFNETSYDIMLPMPLPKDFEITLFGGEIIACDYDITNVEVTFDIEPAGKLTITSLGPINQMNKCHKASVKIQDRITKNETYTMTVRDKGDPIESSTATLNIYLDKEKELPRNPIFEKSYYKADYNIDETGHTLKVIDSISLEEGCNDIDLKLLEYNNNLKVNCKNNKIDVDLIKDLDESTLEDHPVILVTIEATLKNAEKPGRTVLVVYLPKEECPEPTTTTTTTTTIATTTECPKVTCPTVPITTEGTTTTCSECPVTECPETECPITCPTSTTVSTDTTTECPECPQTCPTTSPTVPTDATTLCPTTECPETECPITCPTSTITSTEKNTACPECPITCPTSTATSTDTTTACSECPVTECPETECPITCPTSTTVSTGTTTECPECPQTCPTTSLTVPTDATTLCPTTECPETECPITCPTSTITSTEKTTACPECPITCPTPSATSTDTTTVCPECPVTCPTLPTVSTDRTTVCPETECPITCPTSTDTTTIYPECPITCPTLPAVSTERTTVCPETECPITCPTSTDATTICPECPITCPTLPTASADTTTVCPETECPITSTTVATTIVGSECPTIGWSETVCPVSSTTFTSETTTECPECPITCSVPTEPSLDEKMEFIKDSYWFDVRSTYEGYLGYVEAKANFHEVIEYKLDPELPFLSYNKNSGELKKIAKAEFGTYETTAYAKGDISGIEVRANVVINMNDNESVLEVVNSVVTKVIEEEKPHSFVLPCEKGQKCVYKFLKPFYPNVDKDFFLYDSQNNTLYIDRIDREMEEIVNMLVPQFVLEFRLLGSSAQKASNYLIGNNLTRLNKPRYANDEDRAWIYVPKEIPHRSDQFILTLIIKDVNDNPPVFQEGTKLVVGYPVKELAQQIAPPHLAQVKATDKDVGLNAEIKYTTDSEHFIIHPKSGVIYPCDDAFDDESYLNFNVIATDQNGEGLNSTPLHIEVRPLTKDNLIILKIDRTTLEDLDEIIEDLSKQTSMHIRHLTAAVIPSLEESKSIVRSIKKYLNVFDTEKRYSTKLVLYGLDDKNKTIKNEKLENALDNVEIGETVSSREWRMCTVYEGDDDNVSKEKCDDESEHDNTGYIAAIAVLASLLLIFLIGALIFYYFKIYKHRPSDLSEPFSTMEEDEEQDSDSINFEKNPRMSSLSKSEEIAKRRPTGFIFNPPPIEENDGDNEPAKRRPTGFVFNPPPIEEDDEDIFGESDKPKYEEPNYVRNNEMFADIVDTGKINSSNNKANLDSPTEDTDRPKSVKFKETVEKINILVDEPEKQDDDVIDERL